MAGLTTHILDLARGRPAAGMRVTLDRLEDSSASGFASAALQHQPPQRVRLADVHTNADGRCDRPLLDAASIRAGSYELGFHAGDYWHASGTEPSGFLDLIPIRFAIADPAAHYHVPLLLSPYGYSTYRGS